MIWMYVPCNIVHWSASPHHNPLDWFWGVGCSGIEYHHAFLSLIPCYAIFRHDNCDCYCGFYGHYFMF